MSAATTIAAETAGALRCVLDAVDAGEVDTTVGQLAYLAGAADALMMLANRADAGVSIPSL